MRRLGRGLVDHWGFAIFCLEIFLTTLRVFRNPRGFNMHYKIFELPGSPLWNGVDPYGLKAFPEWLSRFSYSPTCAMFFLRPFTALPHDLGLVVFVAVSLAMLTYGIVYLIRSLRREMGIDLRTLPTRHLVWLLFGGELMGAILYTKIEIFELGLVLLALGMLLERRAVLAFAILGFVCNWKLQFLPSVGLALVAGLATGAGWRPVAAFAAAFGGSFLLPLVRWSPAALIELHRHWIAASAEAVEQHWMLPNYWHVYRIVWKLGGSVSLEMAGVIGAIAGSLFALYVGVWSARLRDRRPPQEAQQWGYLLGVSLGIMHLILFSPFSQHNAFFLFFPVLLSIAAFSKTSKLGMRTHQVVLFLCLALISISGSDLVPPTTRSVLLGMLTRVYGMILLTSLLFADSLAFLRAQPTTRAS